MKAILEFNLPEDAVEHELAVNAGKYRDVLLLLDNELRRRVKYSTEESIKETTDTVYSEVRNLLNFLLQEEGIAL